MTLRMIKRVLSPAEVCVGAGSLERLAFLDPARVLVVTGSSSQRIGTLDRLVSQLREAKALEVLDHLGGEPRAEVIAELALSVAGFAPEWIVALGGGTVMDAAKFLWAQYEHPGLVFSAGAVIPPLRQKARFVALPTTAGSGSEASQAAVLRADDGTKIPFVSPHWLPDIAILDPALTVGLPRETTVATGFDALTHAIESGVSNLANPMLQALAATAISLVVRHLPVAVENPCDLAARGGMLNAAYLGGLCQSTASTGAAHALSHATSKLHRTSHGAATGFYLLPAMRCNRAKNPVVYDALAGMSGFADGASLEAAVAELAARLAQPQRFSDLVGRNLDSSERQALAQAAAKDICLRTNACRFGISDLIGLLEQIV